MPLKIAAEKAATNGIGGTHRGSVAHIRGAAYLSGEW